jgi:lactate dehydrogenase-like 2-hydroxyacid dehydrogenase
VTNKLRVLVTRRHLFEIEKRLLDEYDVVLNEDDHIMSSEEIISASDGSQAIFLCVTEPLSDEVINALPKSVEVILTLSAGVDHIDIEAARERGIAVLATPGAVTLATAEIGVLLMLGAARRAQESISCLRSGNWRLWTATQFVGIEITGKPLGIYGMGRIGQTLSKRARGFDMDVYYHNRNRLSSDLEEKAVYIRNIEEFLGSSKFLALCAPSTPQTHKFLNTETIECLPDGAVIVNIARGNLVDDDALIIALKSGKIAAAGLDVYNGEPTNIDARYFELSNVFMLPHIGSASREARISMGMMLLDGYEAFRNGRTAQNRVV